MEAFLLQPRGFCAGVTRAIEIVRRALVIHGAPVYVLHEIVHNEHVVEELRGLGAVFVEQLDEVPRGAVTIFSAHGVAASVVEAARARDLQIIDATCPLVTKVHLQAQRYERTGYELIIIGHPGHPEVEGTRGRIAGPVHVLSTPDEARTLRVRDPERVAYVTQTTLSIDDTRDVIEALRRRFPRIQGPELDDICYATQNRQNAVRQAAQGLDLLLVVGARNSSNSNRLKEVGEDSGIPSHLIQSAADVDPSWLSPGARVGVTAGASAPELLVAGVLERLAELGCQGVRELDGVLESTVFALPAAVETGPYARS